MTQHKTSKVWLFDLDNTLHHASHAIFPLINFAMTQAIQDYLLCDHQTANHFRIKYWCKYGATMLGMVRHHAMNPIQFLQQSHPLDMLKQGLIFKPGIQHIFKKLPGKKIIFTNSPKSYALTLLKQMKLHHEIDEIISIEACKLFNTYRPKPSKNMLQHLLVVRKLNANNCILVDDTLVNLKAAYELGLKTVWVTQWAGQTDQQITKKIGRPSWCHAKIASVFQLPNLMGL